MSYDVAKLRRAQSVAELDRENAALHNIFGFDLGRRNNLSFISRNVLIYAYGNAVVFDDLTLHAKRYLLGLDDGGVGCVAVHPSRTMFAVGGKGFQPKIYIYSYPDLNVLKILPGGADRGYACLSFNAHGNQLASVSTSPDYMLTVWDWAEEKIALHSKAFGQDVFNVRFSADDDRRLTTSGTGHIRFWKMAATFTGLKLQGNIGKFGKVELSDIGAFVELPDGKVLSGTESGALLLWEGNFIKCRFVQPGGYLCHEGEVTHVDLNRQDKCIVTAGIDGYVRWWNLAVIDSAEVDSDNSMDFELTPIATYSLNHSPSDSEAPNGETIPLPKPNRRLEGKRGIRLLLDGGQLDGERTYVVLDSTGTLSSITYFNYGVTESCGIPSSADVTAISSCHAGAITGLDTCPTSHLAMTCGVDGTVRCWNYLARKVIGLTAFPFPATCLRWTPPRARGSGLSAVVGFDDGCVRVLNFIGNETYSEQSFILSMVFKPHRVAVVDLCFSSDGSMFATSGKDGSVFFFNCTSLADSGAWTPLRFVVLAGADGVQGSVVCDKIDWNESNDKVFCTCSDGVLREIDISELRSGKELMHNEVKTYEYSFPVRVVSIATTTSGIPNAQSQSNNSSKEDIDDNDTDNLHAADAVAPPVQAVVAKVTSVIRYSRDATPASPSSHAVLGVLGGPVGQLLECNLAQDVPLREHKYGLYSIDGKDLPRAPAVSTMRYSYSGRFLLMGTSAGAVIVRPTKYIESFISFVSHNDVSGGTKYTSASFDDNFVLSAGSDGLLVVHRINPIKLLLSARNFADDLPKSLTGIGGVKRDTRKGPEPKFLSVMTLHSELEGFHDIDNLTIFPDNIPPPERNATDLPRSAYCIEDEKLKSEDDVKRDSADRKKRKVKAVINALQREYENLLAQNARLPKSVQLSDELMTVDGEFFGTIKKQAQERLLEVNKECAYEAERAQKLVAKVKSRLMGDIYVEDIYIQGFRHSRPILVHSLRTKGLDAALRSLAESVHAAVKGDLLAEMRNRLNTNVTQRKGMNASHTESVGNLAMNSTQLNSSVGERSGSSVARRADRKVRKAKLEAHLLQKPKEDEDDERDIRAIELAEKSLGLYRLKCSDDYDVPENQRVNAEKKKRQMVLLEESMVTMRLRYNERFLSLRQLKKNLIESIRVNNARIRDIDHELGIDDSDIVWEPVLDPAEFPDDRDEVTQDELLKYKQARSKNPWLAVQPPPHSTVTGTKTLIKFDPETGTYFLQAAGDSQSPVATKLSASETLTAEDMAQSASNDCVLHNFLTNADRSSNAKEIAAIESALPVLQFAKQSISRSGTSNINSANVEARSALERNRRLEFEKRVLLQKTNENVKSFDLALDELRQERHEVLADLKLAELKLIVLYQEYMLLQTFEGRDHALQQKQVRCLREKNEIKTSLTDCQNKMDGKLEDMRDCNEKLKAVFNDLSALIPENHAFLDTLTKIFKKKIKRSKKGDENKDDEDAEEEEDDDDDDDDEEEEIDDNCPLGCEVTLYDKILDLREKRLDQEEAISEAQKTVDDLKKTTDRLKQREKQIDKDSKQTEMEIRQFQLQKQAAVNVIHIVVPIRIAQIYCFDQSGKISGPSDRELSEAEQLDFNKALEELKDPDKRSLFTQMQLNTHVLIKKEALDKLQRRIGELHTEADGVRAELQSLHKERVRLEKEREEQRDVIDTWNRRINEVQMTKFGRLVDLDELDMEADNSKEEETSAAIERIQKKHDTLVTKLITQKDKLKDDIAAETRKNTELLKEVAKLAETKLAVTRDLNSSTEIRSHQDSKQVVAQESEERWRVTSYVSIQAREISSLKTEITMLKRKDPMMATIVGTGALPLPPSNGDLVSDTRLRLTNPAMFPPIPVKKSAPDASVSQLGVGPGGLATSQKRVDESNAVREPEMELLHEFNLTSPNDFDSSIP